MGKPRTSSIQVETTKTQNEQLKAIKKEVEFLQKEVPHFADIYSESNKVWMSKTSKSNRNKAESEAFALIQCLSEWIHQYGNKAVKQYDEFKQSAETEILSMVTKMDRMTTENTKYQLMIEEAENEKAEIQEKWQ